MPEKSPVISIIIPAYNAAGFILETLHSVFQQTFRDFEVIVVNDGSTDNTLEVLASVTDPRMRVITKQNQGVCAARNTGIQAARGEYLAFLDNDDLWTPDKLEAQLNALKSNPKAGVAYSWTKPFYTNSDKVCEATPYYFIGDVYNDLLQENFIGHGSNILATRAAVESVGGYDEQLPYVADWDFCLRLAAKWEYALVPKPQIFYRLSTTSMSINISAMENQFITLLKRAHPRSNLSYRQLVSNNYIHLLSICLSRSSSRQNVPQLLTLFKKALASHPLSVLMNDKTLTNLLKVFKIMIMPPVVQAT
jgi:glycosyltransferase involved in cell wall biosynthesis